MSSTSTSISNDAPASAPIQPMHNPSQAAHVVFPQAPLGNTTNGKSVVSGMSIRALLAKRMAKSNNPKFVSPTDNMVTPVTQKLNAAKQKRFAKGAKPSGSLFSNTEEEPSEEQQTKRNAHLSDAKSPIAPAHEDANPFE